MASEITWSPISLDLGWGCMAGKACVIGGGECTNGLRILGIHGWLDNANSFDALAPYLPSGSDLLVLDLPGHGHSDHLPDGVIYDLINYCLNMKRAVDKIGWDRFIFLAHSMGATLSCIFNALFPERVMAIVSLDHMLTAYPFVKNLQTNIAIHLKGEELRKQTPPVYSEHQAIERLISARGMAAIDEDAAYILLPRSARQVEGGYMWSHDQRAKAQFSVVFSMETYFNIIACIKCPFLMIPANQGMCGPAVREAKKETLEWYRSHIKWFEMVPVDGCHHVHLTHPERVAKPLVRFLERIAQEASSSKQLKARL